MLTWQVQNSFSTLSVIWRLEASTAVVLVFNKGLVVIGVMRMVSNSHDAFGYISTIFGLIGLSICRNNIKQFMNPPKEKGVWLFNHIGRMIGGYFATVIAFSTLNMHFLPTIVQ